MASAPDTEEAELSSALERLLRNRDLSLLLPFLLGFASSSPSPPSENPNPDHQTPISNPHHDRIILINPFTQGMVVIDGTDTLDSLLREFAAKSGQPPASKASIEAMPSVPIGEIGDDNGECSICLEEWETGQVVKQMPCKHKFHGTCIEKWLGIHGSCPVCRYKMPVDKEEASERRDQEEEAEGEEGRERRGRRRTEREIWVSFSFNRDRRNQSTNQTPSTDSNDIDTSSPALDQQLEG